MNINRNNYESWFLDYHEGTLSPQQVAELLLFLDQHPELREEFESFELIELTNDIPAVNFEDKASLLRPSLSEEDVRTWMLDVLEGNRNDRNELEKTLTSFPALAKEWKLLQRTILPAATVSFDSKSLLKKKEEFPAGYDYLLIAESEGDLQSNEKEQLSQLLKEYPALQHERSLFAATHLEATPVYFEGKESLKKKSARVIAFHQQMVFRIAAMLVLLIGAWITFTYNQKPDTQFASQKPAIIQPSQKPSGIQNQEGDTNQLPIETQVEEMKSPTTSPQLAHTFPKKRIRVTVPENRTEDISSENLATIEPMPLRAAYIEQEEPFVHVQRRTYFGSVINPETEGGIALNVEDIVNDFVKQTNKTVTEVTENTPLAAETESGIKLTLSGRILRSCAWAITKVSDNRIRVKTTYNPLTGSLAACEVKTANRKWQKEF